MYACYPTAFGIRTNSNHELSLARMLLSILIKISNLAFHCTSCKW